MFKKQLSLALSCAIAFPLTTLHTTNETICAVNTDVTYGDVNNDGTINVLDMILFKSYITENNKDNFCIGAADLM